jgi:hypothetical protein
MTFNVRKRVDKYTFVLVFATVACALAVPSLHAKEENKFLTVSRAVGNQYIVVLKHDSLNPNINVLASQFANSYGGSVRHVYQHALRGFSVGMSKTALLLSAKTPALRMWKRTVECPSEITHRGGLIELIKQIFLSMTLMTLPLPEPE